MFQKELARPLALLVGLFLMRQGGAQESSRGLPSPPMPAPSATTPAPPGVLPPAVPSPAVVTAPTATPPGSPGPPSLPAAGDDADRAGSTPRVIRPPDAGFPTAALPEPFARPAAPFFAPFDPPVGFTGPSSVVPVERQQDPHFVPIADRWRTGMPAWDRYGSGHPVIDDYPYMPGRWYDAFNRTRSRAEPFV